ncbi:MAG TPA: hypothetical protein VHI13_13830 [Candidatus Kapabacteria bacterium]|nr:hypothetical protein [Candidatus Kapabacteria bacterium]
MKSATFERAAVALAAIAIIATGGVVHAQPLFTNPPCTNVAVTSTSPCTAVMNLVMVPAGAWPNFTVPAGGTFNLPVPNTGVLVTGVVDVFGVTIPLNAPPGPGCGPGAWWVANVALDPLNPACTVSICFDPLTCTITIR